MSKPHHFTSKEDVTDNVAIWAIPRAKHEIEEGMSPFYFKLHTNNPWTQGATKVIEYPVTLTVPPGIDLLAKAIETLQEKKKDILARAQVEANDITEQINQLLMISYQPDPITGNDPTIIEVEKTYGEDTIVERMNDDDGIPF